MLDSYIIWNGVSSASFGLYVKKEPNFNKPKRKYSAYPAEGRNGDIIVLQDAWENVIQEYTFFLRPENLNVDLSELSHQIAAWLHSTDDYAELTDSYDANHYRLAYFVDEINIENHLNQFGSASVRFNCRPEFFLNSGLVETSSTTSPITITNPTIYRARPIIRITRSDANASSLVIGETSIDIKRSAFSENKNVTIDCDKKILYRTTNSTEHIAYDAIPFPYLSSGENVISWESSNITKVRIVPNWWEL